MALSPGRWLLLGQSVVSLERILVVALAIASTLAAGLTADPRERTTITSTKLALVIAANVLALPLMAYVLVRVGSVEGAGGLVLAAAAPGGCGRGARLTQPWLRTVPNASCQYVP